MTTGEWQTHSDFQPGSAPNPALLFNEITRRMNKAGWMVEVHSEVRKLGTGSMQFKSNLGDIEVVIDSGNFIAATHGDDKYTDLEEFFAAFNA